MRLAMLVVVVLALAGGCLDAAERSPGGTESDDRVVLSTVLRSYLPEPDGAAVSRSLTTSTREISDFLPPAGTPGLEPPDDVLEDIRVRNEEQYRLTAADFEDDLNVVLVEDDEVPEAAEGSQPWLDFESRNGSASVMGLSLPGFARDGSQALVYVGRVCGWMCGEGIFFVLRRAPESRWRIESQHTAWIS